jgi:hypothetical protein
VATKPSKFSSIFLNEEEPVVENTPVRALAPATEQPLTPELLAIPNDKNPEAGSAPNRRTGRPATGKKSDPNYRQVTAYVRKDLYREVTDALHDDNRGRDTKPKEFSQLVDELLKEWRDKRSGRNAKVS